MGIEEILGYTFWIYFCLITLLAIVITCYDKIAAKKFTEHRVPDKTLFLISILGGSVGMYLTMLIIRHKTKHMKFMIFIPVIIILQLAALICAFFLL